MHMHMPGKGGGKSKSVACIAMGKMKENDWMNDEAEGGRRIGGNNTRRNVYGK